MFDHVKSHLNILSLSGQIIEAVSRNVAQVEIIHNLLHVPWSLP